MYAKVATTQVQSGKMDEFLKIYRETQRSINEQAKGFQSARILTDSNTGKSVVISMWETESDARASSSESILQDVTRRFEGVFGAITMEYYEVSVDY